jgi:hypothetical protein
MARITPSSGSTLDLTALDDDEPYRGILRKPKDGWFSEGDLQYSKTGVPERRLTVDWEIENGETIRDWIGLRLGINNKNGQVSKLRMLLNALSEKPRDTWLWFDPETLEWGYDEAQKVADNKLIEGMEVVFRGVKGKKQDGKTDKYTVQKYQAPKAKAAGKNKLKADDGAAPF